MTRQIWLISIYPAKNQIRKGVTFTYSTVDPMISILLFFSSCKIEHLLFFFGLGFRRMLDLNKI